MRRTPGFTALAIVMLALGIGVNTALFSVIDAVRFRLPFGQPDRIVSLRFYGESPRLLRAIGLPEDAAVPFTRLDRFEAVRSSPGPFTTVAGYASTSRVVTGGGDPRGVDVECVTPAMFDVLGVSPHLGRTLVPADSAADAPPAVVLSYPMWQRLGGVPEIVGRVLHFDGAPGTVVGVMPADFAGPFSRNDVSAWLPIYDQAGGGALGCVGERIEVVARLQDGLDIDDARAGLTEITFDSILEVEEGLYGTRAPFLALTGAVICVLLIACVNVGGLQLERSIARRREIAVRLAMGATGARLVRQLLTEHLLLAVAGAIAGVAAAYLALPAIVSLLPTRLPRLDLIGVNGRVLGAAAVVAVAVTILASVLPVVSLRRFSLRPTRELAGAGRRASGVTRSRGRRALVIVEIALSVVVLVSAGLMIQTFLTLRPTRPGFDPRGKQSLLVRLPGASPENSRQFFESLFERLELQPAVVGLAGATYLPMRGSCLCRDLVVGDVEVASVRHIHVTPSYFGLMGIAVKAGRPFSSTDIMGAEPVAIVNESLARRLSSEGPALGRMLPVGMRSVRGSPVVVRRIVGIVGDTRAEASNLAPEPELYVPFAQDAADRMFVIAESSSAAAGPPVASALRAGVRELRPDVVIEEVESLPAMLAGRLASWRFPAWLLGVFAALAVLLAAVGLATTIGWWVRQRTREIGIRAALGATRRDVALFVFGQGLPIAATGIAIGCICAAVATRWLESELYGITPLDAMTFSGAAVAMVAVAGIALALPARRARAVDPAIALRSE